MATTSTESKGRTLRGVVVSDKMTKTIVVRVDHLKKNAKYQKFFRVSTRYKVHDEKDYYHVGERVVIRETRPLSKTKRWEVVGVIYND